MLDAIAISITAIVGMLWRLAVRTRRYDGQDVVQGQVLAETVAVVALVGEQGRRLWHRHGHEAIDTAVIGSLPARQVARSAARRQRACRGSQPVPMDIRATGDVSWDYQNLIRRSRKGFVERRQQSWRNAGAQAPSDMGDPLFFSISMGGAAIGPSWASRMGKEPDRTWGRKFGG